MVCCCCGWFVDVGYFFGKLTKLNTSSSTSSYYPHNQNDHNHKVNVVIVTRTEVIIIMMMMFKLYIKSSHYIRKIEQEDLQDLHHQFHNICTNSTNNFGSQTFSSSPSS